VLKLNRIYNVDCIDGIQMLDDNSIDAVITSPPYNVDLGNNKYNKNSYSLYNDNKEHSEYIDWLKQIFTLLKPKLKIGGRICINIGDSKNGAIPTSSDIIQFMTKEIGYIIITNIIWNKNTTSARTSWGSWLSPSCPSYPCPYEHILIFANENKKLQHKGKTDLTKEEFVSCAYGIWNITPETKLKEIGHPAPFPIEIPKRLIKMNTYIGDTVLDIFMGSGSTAIVCKQLNRNYIGFEIDKRYCEIAESRIKNVN